MDRRSSQGEEESPPSAQGADVAGRQVAARLLAPSGPSAPPALPFPRLDLLWDESPLEAKFGPLGLGAMFAAISETYRVDQLVSVFSVFAGR